MVSQFIGIMNQFSLSSAPYGIKGCSCLAGLEEVFWMLSRTRERPGFVTQLLANTFDYKASQLTG
jgi:hypothetical protein